MLVRFSEKTVVVYIIKGFDAKAAGCIGMVLEPYEFPMSHCAIQHQRKSAVLFPIHLYICNIYFTRIRD